MEKEDLPLFAEWFNNSNPEFLGEYFSPFQRSRTELEKMFENSPFEDKVFFIEKKDGTKIGYIMQFNMIAPYTKLQEIGYFLVPNERSKGYCTEATQLLVDYLFLSKDVTRIQATTHTKNAASQKVLGNVGFKKEGTLRKSNPIRGELADMFIFSILREEWKEPKNTNKDFLRNRDKTLPPMKLRRRCEKLKLSLENRLNARYYMCERKLCGKEHAQSY